MQDKKYEWLFRGIIFISFIIIILMPNTFDDTTLYTYEKLMAQQENQGPMISEHYIMDLAKISNLKPGKAYTIKTTLYDKKTHEPCRNEDGTTISASFSFVPKTRVSIIEIRIPLLEGYSSADVFLVEETHDSVSSC